MSEWVEFTKRFPTRSDADDAGFVQLRESNGKERAGMYDWIPPYTPSAVDWWHANGFTAWKRLK